MLRRALFATAGVVVARLESPAPDPKMKMKPPLKVTTVPIVRNHQRVRIRLDPLRKCLSMRLKRRYQGCAATRIGIS